MTDQGNVTWSHLAPAEAQALGAGNYANPAPDPGVLFGVVRNSCGESATLAKSVDPAFAPAGSNVVFTITVTNNPNGRLKVYRSNGFPNNAVAGSVNQFVLCDVRGNVTTVGGDSAARAVTIETTGRATATRDKARITGLGGCP